MVYMYQTNNGNFSATVREMKDDVGGFIAAYYVHNMRIGTALFEHYDDAEAHADVFVDSYEGE